MPWGMAGGEDGNNARHEFRAGAVAVHVLSQMPKDAADVEEIAFDRFGRGSEVGVIRPKYPFRFRNEDLGIGENQCVVLGLKAIDVIGMKMGYHDGINRFRRGARGPQIGFKQAGGWRDLATRSSVNQNQF